MVKKAPIAKNNWCFDVNVRLKDVSYSHFEARECLCIALRVFSDFLRIVITHTENSRIIFYDLS